MLDLREPVCECPDFQYRESVSECKHIRRVRIEVGQIDVDALEASLSEQADDIQQDAEELKQAADELTETATELEDAISRLREVAER